MRKIIATWLLIILIVSAIAIVFPININSSESQVNSPLYTSHDPIYINGNADFTAENGVTGGTGSSSDPYIIEGWDINASSADGIAIRNTDAYFIIRNCYVHDGRNNYDDGIYFYNVQNGTAENTSSISNYHGISLDSSNDNNIFCNNASNNEQGISLSLYSDYNTVSNNSFNSNDYNSIFLDISCYNTISNNSASNNDNGIRIEGSCDNNIISNNVFNSNRHNGILLRFDNYNNTISNNTLNSNNYYGISFQPGNNNNTILNNTINLNNDSGLFLDRSDNNIILNNTIDSNNGVGIDLLFGSNDNWIYHNNLINNTPQAYDEHGTNYWDNGYPSGGNYWSDYTGIDEKRGPNQDEPGADGIGDTPRNISGGSNQDHYPLMTPWGVTLTPPTNIDARLDEIDFQDVNITWNLSKDDENIANYALYYNTSYEKNGTGYSFLSEIAAGVNYYVHSSAGDGDSNNYFYYIQANGTSGENARNETQVAKYAREMPYSVDASEQLISLPLVQSETNISTVLQTIQGSYNHVQWYNPLDTTNHWKTNATFKPKGFDDLFNVDHKMALWITMTSSDNLTIAGKVPEQTSIQLYEGWNLVSYASFINRTVESALSGIPYEKVEGFDENNPPYFLKTLSGSDWMEAGCGYWIHVTSDCVWTIYN